MSSTRLAFYPCNYGVLTVVRRVLAGSPIVIPILTLNRSKAIWGEDAHEFRYVYRVLNLRSV